MSTLVLSRADVRGLLDMDGVIRAVEQAFLDWESGKGAMPVKAYLVLERGDFRAMPAALPAGVGIKWVNVHPQNPARGLPTVMATIIYSDPETGYPLAIMDGTDITAYRTGAAAAIASRYLARRDSHVVGLIGAGRQADTQLMAHAALFEISQVRVYDPVAGAVQRFIQDFPGFSIQPCGLEQACAADILCTVTPAREPVVKKEWLLPGTHINAIGADAPGKEELEPDILNSSTVVVDDIRQSSKAGEINVPISKGLYRAEQVYGTLGEVIAGKKPGRTDPAAITVFDSTGLAIEDIAAASLVYRRAREKGGYLSIDFV